MRKFGPNNYDFEKTFGRGWRQGVVLAELSRFCRELWVAPITPCPPCGGAANLKTSPLPPAPLAVAGFLVAWQYSDRFAGLLVCWVFAVCFFVLLVFSVEVCAASLVFGCGFWSVLQIIGKLRSALHPTIHPERMQKLRAHPERMHRLESVCLGVIQKFDWKGD